MELCLLSQTKAFPQMRHHSSHLFLKKSLCFIFNLSTVISQFSLLGKPGRGSDNPIFPSPEELPPLPTPDSSLEISATSSPATVRSTLACRGVILKIFIAKGVK